MAEERMKGLQYLLVVLAGMAAIAAILGGRWLNEGKEGGQQEADPFHIAGNLYFVGANDVSAFLLTGPEGHVLLDAGYPSTAPMILESVRKLGFEVKDIQVLVNSEPHPDHAGGLTVVQQATGAKLWASEASADSLSSGGGDPDMMLPMRAVQWLGLVGYPAARVDRRFGDGEKLRLGPIEMTAHITGGHTRGCTSWSFVVLEGGRQYPAVSVCDLTRLSTVRYDEQEADLRRSFQVLRALPAEIWVTNHGRAWGRYRKFEASREAKGAVEPFVDPAGYRAFIDRAEKELQEGMVH